ncbi:hypothetical protein V7128_01865 [Neobacillus vireti]|uniref:hypothetical protein n=1 Tax=Neobacillus vireti TaxID=220686 RepID=UPI002FFEBD2F
MGMYTGIRFKGIIKEEFAPVINIMMEERLYWDDLYNLFPQYDFLGQFSEVDRSTFIPYGSLSYMPDEWENIPRTENGSYDYANATDTDGFERKFDTETRQWSFQCSLKNYESTIQRFFEIVLPEITEKILHLEYYYEESIRSTFYDLVDGKVVKSDREGIKYQLDESDYEW